MFFAGLSGLTQVSAAPLEANEAPATAGLAEEADFDILILPIDADEPDGHRCEFYPNIECPGSIARARVAVSVGH